MPALQRNLVLVSLVATIVVLGGLALDQYNLTWDEALGDLFFGERYLDFFRTLDGRYLDFAADPYPPDHRPDLSSSPFRNRPWEYYPVANLMAAATSRTLTAVGLTDPFDGYHAVNLWLGALLAATLFLFLERRFGLLHATTTVLLLFLGPRVVAHLLSNTKDFPSTVLFTLSALAWISGFARRSDRRLLAAGAVWGLALGTKANALFVLPVVAVLWLVGRDDEGAPVRTRRLAAVSACGLALGSLLFLASWPYLWADPLDRLARHWSYISGRIGQTRPESFADPLVALLLTTPPILLFFFLLGLPALWRGLRQRRVYELGVASWIVVTLARLYVPGAVNFDGVRHFLEILPPLAMVAGGGCQGLVAALPGLSEGRRRIAACALAATIATSGLLQVSTWHPFGLAYWNVFAGGLAGARGHHAQAGDYWAGTYRLGLRWLDDNAPPGSALAVPIAEHAVSLVAPERLRTDIGLLDLTRPEGPELRPGAMEFLAELASVRPTFVMFAVRDDWSNELTDYCQERLDPVVVWQREGVPLLLIYRLPAGPARPTTVPADSGELPSLSLAVAFQRTFVGGKTGAKHVRSAWRPSGGLCRVPAQSDSRTTGRTPTLLRRDRSLAQPAKNGRGGGKQPSGNGAVSSPRSQCSAAIRYAARNSE